MLTALRFTLYNEDCLTPNPQSLQRDICSNVTSQRLSSFLNSFSFFGLKYLFKFFKDMQPRSCTPKNFILHSSLTGYNLTLIFKSLILCPIPHTIKNQNSCVCPELQMKEFRYSLTLLPCSLQVESITCLFFRKSLSLTFFF